MQPNLSNMSFRNNKRQILQRRAQRFDRIRKNHDKMQTETPQELVERITDVDYCKYYDEKVRTQLEDSLQAAIPEPLPPLDLTTISLYRRAGKSVYQCRQLGHKELDPHMTYESLLMLGHTDAKDFGNYGALVKEFQRDLKWYLKVDSKDIREMAIVAAGNKILGQEDDILGLVRDRNTEFLWVLINHTYENRISSRYMMPFFLKKNQLAFKTFSQLTCNMHDDSILFLAENDDAIDCLMEAMDTPGPLCTLAVKIISNMLGQGQGHWKLFYHSKLLDRCLDLIVKANSSLQLMLMEMLCSFVCESGAATAVLRHPTAMPYLLNMLNHFGGLSGELRRELLNTFSFMVYKAEEQEVFSQLMRNELFSICSGFLGIDQELDLSALQLVCGLVELGEKFPNEQGQNIAGFMISSDSNLSNQIQQLSMSENNYVSGLAITIKEKLEGMEEQL